MPVGNEILLDVVRTNSIKFESKDSLARLPFVEHPSHAILDDETRRLTQVDQLHAAIDNTRTDLGSLALFESLMHPPTNLDLIRARQKAVVTLNDDETLLNSVRDYLEKFYRQEGAIIGILEHPIRFQTPGTPYRHFKNAMDGGKQAVLGIEDIPETQSSYINKLLEGIRQFETSPQYPLMRGPIHRTRRGLRSKEGVKKTTPRWRFKPQRFTGATAAAALGTTLAEAFVGGGGRFTTTTLIGALFYGSMLKPTFDDQTVIKPIREDLLLDQQFMNMLYSVAQLDQIVSFVEYARNAQHEVSLPTITNDPQHHFMAQGLLNPILVKGNRNFVPNDVVLTDARVTYLTGPNSGGKTTICKSIIQAQLLAQMGSPVPATKAVVNISDHIAYQAPSFDALDDAEGRFGTELARTRDLFHESSPRSLVVLDELAEGTTVEERLDLSNAILDGFETVGGTTILVTHNHALARSREERTTSQCLQVEFDGERPTHRIISGISEKSHANLVARRLGFSKMDIDNHLQEKGYRPK